MQKKEFVQHAAISFMPKLDYNLEQSVRYAEKLWCVLTDKGYGAPEKQGPKQHMDWYGALSDQQKAWFDRFWKAFNLKSGKQGAAMRWGQISPDEHTAEWIIASAAKEAHRELDHGVSRKWAQGWLQERRWEDWPPPGEQREQSGASERAAIQSELNHLQWMIECSKNDETRAQLQRQQDDLRARL